jgi:HlyD family secretion protein
MPDSVELASLRIERTAPAARTYRRRRRPWRWLVAVAIGILAVWGGCCLLVPPEVTVAAAARASMQGDAAGGELSAAGYIVADRKSTVAAKYTTRLARLLVREAAIVEKGQLLAELDHRELDAAIAEAAAEVARAQAAVEEARAGTTVAEAQTGQARDTAAQVEADVAAAEAASRTAAAAVAEAQVARDDAARRQRLDEALVRAGAAEANRVEDRRTEVRLTEARLTLAEHACGEAGARVTAARARLAVARSAIAAAEAQTAAARAGQNAAAAVLQAAEARAESLQARLDDHYIRAPFAGVVTERIVAPLSVGGTQAKGAIVTVIESASLQAEVDVAESQLARVKPGGRARITVDAFPGEVFPGTVQRILPLVDRGKATVKARVDFRAVDARFLLDMAVRVRFLPPDAPPGAEEGLVPDPLLVPAGAVVSEGGRSWVWTVGGDRARRQPVTPGAARGERLEIAEGLAEGTLVVATGAGALRRDGQRVRVRPPAGAQ